VTPWHAGVMAGVAAGLAVAVATFAGSSAAAAQGQLKALAGEAQGAGATDCDRLAQPPRAAMGGLPALAEGVSFADLRWPGARAACAKAMADAPSEVRFVAFAARAADKGGDQKTAAQLYRAAADEGYPLAQTNLGVMYEDGQGGLARSDREAERLYRLAADQGFPAGQASLATFYVSGRGGLRRDDREAVRLWRLAADSGNAQAQNNLGKMYAEGRGGALRDLSEAARLWRLAADGGVAEARSNLRKVGRH
jgi:TPR repeat protein